MKAVLIVFCVHIFFNYSLCVWKDLAFDFISWKNVHFGTLFTCDDKMNITNILRSLSAMGKQFTVETSNKRLNVAKMHHDYDLTGIIMDLDCVGFSKILKDASLNGMFNYTYLWLITTTKKDVDIEAIFKNLQINIDADITFAVAQPNDHYILYDVYNQGKNNGGSLNISFLFAWNNVSHLIEMPKLGYKYARRANMTGVILKCMIVVTQALHGETFERYIQTPSFTHIDSMNRFNYALLLHLKDIFNFSYNMMRTSSWGYKHNGSFDGMVGYLEKKQADIGGSPIFFRLERAQVVDYTIQTWVSRSCFIFRHPKRVGSFLKMYIRPFQENVWCCAVAVALVGIVGLHRTLNASHTVGFRPQVNDETSWSFSVMLFFGAVCQQGFLSNVNLTSGRIIILTILLSAILFYQFFSASIVSSLLMEPPRNIKTLQDLVDSPLRAGCEDIVYNIDYFSRTTDSVALELYHKKINTPAKRDFLTPAAGLALVKDGGFAFHVDIATAYKIIRDTFSEQEICELVEIQLFPPQRMMAVVQKGSPFRKLVTYGLRRITEVGLTHRQKTLWHERKPPCVKRADVSEFRVSVVEFASALLILLIGVVASFLILLAEILKHKKKQKTLHAYSKNRTMMNIAI